MKRYAHIENGEVVLVLDYKMTSKFNESDIVEFNSIENGNFVLKNGKIEILNIENNIDVNYKKSLLNQERDNELKGFTIDNIFLNKEIIKDMAVKFTTLGDDEKARWIDVNNKEVELSKAELGALVKQGTDKVEAIYFKYRQLKDELEAE